MLGHAECFTFEKAQTTLLAKFNGHCHGSFLALAKAREREEAVFFSCLVHVFLLMIFYN